LQEYETQQLPARFELVVQSWDTANKASELADFSACTTWGLYQQKIYPLHVLRQRLDYPNLKRAVWQQYALCHPDSVLIEDKGSGTQLIQELRADGLHAVMYTNPEGQDHALACANGHHRKRLCLCA